MPDAVEILEHDHRKVEGLFEKYKAGDTKVVREICNELTVHTMIEEQILYPALAGIPQGPELKIEAEHEHQEVKDAIERLERTSPDTAEAESLMATIIGGVTHHVREEEGEVLPKMKRELGEARMTSLGEQLMAAKREELVRLGVLIDLTRDELYQLAQNADIHGRSDMTKDQLIEALQT